MNEDNYRTYYDISRDQLRAAKLLLHSYPNDDGMINIAAYNLQQSIELGLKHILMLCDIKIPKTHNIYEIIRQIPYEYKKLFSEIYMMSDKISDLESETRYNTSFKVSSQLIHDVTALAENLHELISNLNEVYAAKLLQEKLENIIWENRFSPDTPEYIFCRNYNKEYKRLGAPTSKEGYDKATQFATKALYFANVSKEKIMSVINELAPMVPYQDEDKPYMLDIVNAVENMPDIKEFMKNQSENENSIKSR